MIESSPRPSESKDESKDTDEESGSSETKGKYSAGRRRLGTFTAKNVFEAPNIHRARPNESSPKKSKELLKDAETARGERQDRAKQEIIERAAAAETPASEKEAPLEDLGNPEQHEIVRRVTEALDAEEVEEAENAVGDDTTALVQTAARKALTSKIREKLAKNPDAPVEEILDEATAEVVEAIEDDGETDEADTVEAEDITATAEGEIPLHAESAEDEDNTIVIPRGGATNASTTGSGGSSTGSGGSGSGSGTGGSSSSGSGSGGGSGSGAGGSGGGGGGGGMPPIPPGGGTPPFGGGPGFGPTPPGTGGAGFNAAPAPAGISIEDLNRVVHRQERIALAQGLLVGGILGYLIGRRRGRIKTERRLLPIQKKLEKQVDTLQTAVLEREQKIRRMAAERAREIATQEEREKFMNRLAAAEAIRAKSREHQREKEAAKQRQQPERLGRMVVEAPAAALAERNEPEPGIQTSRDTVTLPRNVEKYSGTELRQAAEKIRVDGTTLKEMWDSGRLNERALRRVMQEFVEGRSVRAALNKELLDEELRFERDPKIRDKARNGFGAASSSTGGGSGGREPVAKAGAAMLIKRLENRPGESAEDPGANPSFQPQSSKNQSLIDKARNQPKSHLAAAGAVIVALIAAILILA